MFSLLYLTRILAFDSFRVFVDLSRLFRRLIVRLHDILLFLGVLLRLLKLRLSLLDLLFLFLYLPFLDSENCEDQPDEECSYSDKNLLYLAHWTFLSISFLKIGFQKAIQAGFCSRYRHTE